MTVQPQISFKSVMPSCEVSDVSKAIEFYKEMLGFDCVFTNGNPVSFAIMSRDGVEICLGSQGAGVPGKNGCYIKLSGVDDLYAEYQKNGVKIVHTLKTEEYGMKEFMIEDLDGNTINFGEPV
ncbi:MAG: VOC family protein [Chthoniobacterales bacterium]